MSMPRIVISIKLLLFIFFCHFIGVVFLLLFPLRQKHECVYSSFSIVSGSFLLLYIIFSSSVIYDWFMGFAMGISCFASLLRAILLLLFVSYFKWCMSVSVLLFTVHNYIYLVSSPSHSHLLSHSITINNFDPIWTVPYGRVFLSVCFCLHTCIVFVRAFIFHSTDGVHCCCCCHWCWFVIFVFCFGLCRFKLNISAAKQFSSISDSCRCGLKNITTPILFDVGTIFNDQFYLWHFIF